MVLQVGTKTIKISAICSFTLRTSVCWMALLWKNFTRWCSWDDEMRSCWCKSAGHHYWLSSDSYWPVPVVPETHLTYQIYLGEPKRNCSRWPDTRWKIPQSTENFRDDKTMLLLCSYWTIIQEDHQQTMILDTVSVNSVHFSCLNLTIRGSLIKSAEIWCDLWVNSNMCYIHWWLLIAIMWLIM